MFPVTLCSTSFAHFSFPGLQDKVGRLIIDGVVDSELWYKGKLHLSLEY